MMLRHALFLLLMIGAVGAATTMAAEPGQKDLDAAIEAKLQATNLQQLSDVVKLCESALDKGLQKDDQAFAEQLLSSTLIQRGTMIAQAIFESNPPNPQWQALRQAAVNDLEKAVNYDDRQPDALYIIARLHSLPGGNRQRALKALEQSIKASESGKPANSDVLTLRAGLRQNREQQLADLNEAIELFPEDVDPLRLRGVLRLTQNEPEEALADFDAALKLDPKNAATHEARGLALVALKRLDEAREAYSKAAELSPESAVPYLQQARISLMAEDVNRALKDLTHALEVDKNNLVALLLRSQALLQLDRVDEALTDVNRALEIQPGLPQALKARAVIYSADEQWEKAIEDLERVRREAPDDLQTLMQMAMIYGGPLKQTGEAVKTYDAIIAANAELPQAYRGRADMLLAQGKQRKAIADYEKALEFNPQDSGVLNNLAWVLATSTDDGLRDGKRSLELATKAVQITEEKAAHILSTLAAAYAETGDFEKALEWSQKAVDNAEGEIRDHLQKELESYRNKKPWREDEPEYTADESATPLQASDAVDF